MIDHPSPANILPHKYPFLLVDKIIERQEDCWIICLKNVTANEDFLNGHLSGTAAMAEVLIIEAMAQASGLIMNYKEHTKAFLSRVSEAHFRKLVVPGDRLIIRSSLTNKFPPLFVFKALAHVENELVSEAEITLAIS